MCLKGLLQSRIAEAPAQQPQTNPSNKVHAFSTSGRQAWFHRVDQSLKKDRLTIESTMCAQRPHSAPTVQVRRTKNILRIKQGLLNQLNKFKTNLWRKDL